MEPEDDLDPSQGQLIVESRQPWDKRPDESQRAFDAFTRYRDSERRSFKSIAEALSCSPQNVWQWSSKYNWRLRCDAFDLEQDRQQRAEFARNRVRMRERHRQLAVAMGNVAAHGLREWQRKIAAGAELNLQPEQVVMLAKASAELEKSTLGVDQEHTVTTINVLMGTHRYDDEKAGHSGEAAGEFEWKTPEQIDAEEYEQLTDAEKKSWQSWKNAPTKRKPLLAGTEEDDPQVN